MKKKIIIAIILGLAAVLCLGIGMGAILLAPTIDGQVSPLYLALGVMSIILFATLLIIFCVYLICYVGED